MQVVISDKRISVCDNELQTEQFEADILMATDYYPFGMAIPERQWYTGSDSSSYRYGYQGSEKEDKIKGSGNSYTTHFRILDVCLGKWLTVDPKSKLTPAHSPYTSMGGNPIWFNDPLGDVFDEESQNRVDQFKASTQNRLNNVNCNIESLNEQIVKDKEAGNGVYEYVKQ